jgi:hypothetical protein
MGCEIVVDGDATLAELLGGKTLNQDIVSRY